MTIPTFTSNPEIVRLVVEGERLSYGHQANSAFAAETSLIEPVPHQRIAVYQHMLGQSRLRFLLADDAGAGKTIMTGLYIREMLARRLIRRVLIAPPAGLVSNWEREMNNLFSLPFRVIVGGDARGSNPFTQPDSDLLIVSVDTLTSERMFGHLRAADIAPYDLVVFDEAHKLSAYRGQDQSVWKSARYKLAEALAGVRSDTARWQLGWSALHLLLLTATPHMGKDFPYYCLWRLLEPDGLSTEDAFRNMPADVRRRHFIRRSKEEMVTMDGRPLYPPRNSDTLSFQLKDGPNSERQLYDATTEYIREYYNRSLLHNQSAARFAVNVFQRRLASSTYALLRTLERRRERLDELIDRVERGDLTWEQMRAAQDRMAEMRDVLEDQTADEERAMGGQEENERNEDDLLRGVLLISLDQLRREREQVTELLDLARRLDGDPQHEDAKFERLREVITDPRFRDEKLIIFTEHRDTLDYLVRRLEALGYAGQIAHIHGGMPSQERENQIAFFKKQAHEGSATYMVATDAAGEGLNMQFCWLMINYDIPWNPARLEQRMGRIHRYGQKHASVVIINLVAANTREGEVMRKLLAKLQSIRNAMGSDKVYDVIGRLFRDFSLRDYMTRVALEDREGSAALDPIGQLTREQVEALVERERKLYGEGEGGDVRRQLPQLQQDLNRETFRRLIPGYVRRYVEKAAPFLGLTIEGQIDACFSFSAAQRGSMDWLLPTLEQYAPEQRECLTVYRPTDAGAAIFMHPGQKLFDALRDAVTARYGDSALMGAVFVDPYATQPYVVHMAVVEVARAADPAIPSLARVEVLESRLIGLRQTAEGGYEVCTPDYLLLLKGASGVPHSAMGLTHQAAALCDQARAYLREHVAAAMTSEKREEWSRALPERAAFIRTGFDFQAAELARQRRDLKVRADAGDRRAQVRFEQVREEQTRLTERQRLSLAALEREPALIEPGEITFVAHALVVPTDDPAERERFDQDTEMIAMRYVMAYERARGAQVADVSKPALARQANLEDWPGFDLHSRRPGNEERAIEVKGRARMGEIELKENEWAKACTLQDKYWLYVVYDCATPNPRLLLIQNPFLNLVWKRVGGVTISQVEIIGAAQVESD